MSTITGNELQVRLLAPSLDVQSVESALAMNDGPAEPFSTGRRQTLAWLSRIILQDTELRADAGSVALGYWLRKANIDRLTETFERKQEAEPDVVFVPAGRVFHVGPGNVATMFVFFLALSYLFGHWEIVLVSGGQNQIRRRVPALFLCLDQLRAQPVPVLRA